MSVEFLSKEDSSHIFEEEWYECSSEDHFWFDWRFEVFLKHAIRAGFDPEKEYRFLDIGSGAGILKFQIEKRTAWIVDCVDLNVSALQQISGGRGKVLYYNIYDQKEEWKEFYDGVLVFDVIEHLERPKLFLKASLFHLKRSGFTFVNVPALPSMYSMYDEKMGHLRRYTTHSLQEACTDDYHISPCCCSYWGFFLLPILSVRTLLFKLGKKGNVVKDGFSPPNQLVNNLLKIIGRWEARWLLCPLLGTSVIFIGKKCE